MMIMITSHFSFIANELESIADQSLKSMADNTGIYIN